MTTLAEFMIIAGADKPCPPCGVIFVEYWENSRMKFSMENRENGRMILDSVQNGPLVWPTVVHEDGTTRKKTYAKLSATKKLQADCDCKATNIVLQGLPPDVSLKGLYDGGEGDCKLTLGEKLEWWFKQDIDDDDEENEEGEGGSEVVEEELAFDSRGLFLLRSDRSFAHNKERGDA
ncbi:hypothetical protein Tco_0380960 [Tanacetum coccineum]